MLTIILQYDANALAAPQSFRDGVQAAATILEAAIYDPITVNVGVGYGEFDNGSIPLNDDISLGGIASEIPVSYSLLTAALAAAATSATDTAAVNSLPATVSLNGQTGFFISGAQAKALGALSATDPNVDGYAGFPTSFTGTALVYTAITELLHAMGLTNSGGVLTLYEYTSPGIHLLTAGTSATPAYFSIDGGNTNLANYDVGFDSTLFRNVPNDPLSVASNATVLTPLDRTEIGVLGYDVTGPPSPPIPSITPIPAATAATTVNVRNVSVAVNAAIPALSLITSVSVPNGENIVKYGFFDQGNGNGHFAINGIIEPDNQWIDVLDTQLSAFQYVGGSTPGSETLDVDAFGYAGDTFTSSAVSQLTATTVPCFCRGTLILTERGEVAVERLAVGDRVRTLSGVLKPIVWIGMGRDLVTRKNHLARPVIVRRGALADDVPARDLYLTHGHALYWDGVLIPVENLINHRSILWDEAARVVEYYHIELDSHDVVFAEGAPTETYHDAGNRAVFQNARDAAAAGARKPTFAPVLQEGEVVETAWAALFTRAGGRLLTDTTDDPDLHLLVDGERVDPVTADDGVYSFAVQRPPAATLFLCSRSAVPSLIGLGRSDHRRLGVPIGRITLWQVGIATAFDHDAPQLREGGCHPAEDGYSWTDGELGLPARFFTLLDSPFTLVVHIRRHCLRYPIAPVLAAAA